MEILFWAERPMNVAQLARGHETDPRDVHDDAPPENMDTNMEWVPSGESPLKKAVVGNETAKRAIQSLRARDLIDGPTRIAPWKAKTTNAYRLKSDPDSARTIASLYLDAEFANTRPLLPGAGLMASPFAKAALGKDFVSTLVDEKWGEGWFAKTKAPKLGGDVREAIVALTSTFPRAMRAFIGTWAVGQDLRDPLRPLMHSLATAAVQDAWDGWLYGDIVAVAKAGGRKEAPPAAALELELRDGRRLRFWSGLRMPVQEIPYTAPTVSERGDRWVQVEWVEARGNKIRT